MITVTTHAKKNSRWIDGLSNKDKNEVLEDIYVSQGLGRASYNIKHKYIWKIRISNFYVEKKEP